MSARPRLVYENLVCALGEGAASLNLSPSGLGPPASDLPAPAVSAQLEIPRLPRPPRSPPPCPGPAPRSSATLEERPRVRDARGPRAAAASPASAGLPAPSLRAPQASLPPVGDTHHFRVRLGRGAPGHCAGQGRTARSLSGQPPRAPAYTHRGLRRGRRVGYQGWGAGLGSRRLLPTPRPPRPALPASRLAPRLAPPTTPRPVPPPRDVVSVPLLPLTSSFSLGNQLDLSVSQFLLSIIPTPQ